MSNFPLQSPKDKPFAPNVRANDNPLDDEQWRQHVIEAIHGFQFGPKAGPLRIPGILSEDRPHLKTLQRELQKIGWIVLLDFLNPESCLIVYHPHDPDYPI